jgi:hypothetical protein
MSHRSPVVAAVFAAVALVAIGAAGAARAASESRDEEHALHAFSVVYAVLESPRCRNCHPSGDAPLQHDEGKPHAMNITRESARVGVGCGTCHRATNADFAHGPPGVPGWRLPAADMPLVFQGKSERDLCNQLKDPTRNGHKSLSDLDAHMAHDPFVAWGWNPGPGRTVPPYSHEAFARAAHEWIAAGAPCP